MSKDEWVKGYRVVFAGLALIAIVYQFIDGRDTDPDFRATNFFSFFTIQSNIFAAIVFLIAARSTLGSSSPGLGSSSPGFDLARGAAVLYLATTGVVYGLLLSGYQEELQTTIPWVDTVLHRVMPLVVVADWFIDPPRAAIPWRRALRWLIYPALYLVYCLIRGPIVDWYPYPFLNPDAAGGYAGVALACLGIAAGITLFAWLVVVTSRQRSAGATA